MSAQVTDGAESIGAVRMGRLFESRSSWWVTRAMLAGRPILPAIDEADRLPALVNGRALVVDEAGVEPDPLHRRKVEVGLDLRGLLGPGDPETVGGRERTLERGEAPLELCPIRREEDDHGCPRLRPQLLREGGRG